MGPICCLCWRRSAKGAVCQVCMVQCRPVTIAMLVWVSPLLTTVFWSHRTPLLFHMLYPFSPAFMYIAAVACSALHVQFLSFYFAPKVRLPTFVFYKPSKARC